MKRSTAVATLQLYFRNQYVSSVVLILQEPQDLEMGKRSCCPKGPLSIIRSRTEFSSSCSRGTGDYSSCTIYITSSSTLQFRRLTFSRYKSNLLQILLKEQHVIVCQQHFNCALVKYLCCCDLASFCQVKERDCSSCPFFFLPLCICLLHRHCNAYPGKLSSLCCLTFVASPRNPACFESTLSGPN